MPSRTLSEMIGDPKIARFGRCARSAEQLAASRQWVG